MNLNPKPADKVRTIVTAEGRYLCFPDMVEQLRQDGVVDEALALLKVGHEQGDSRDAMRHAIGGFLLDCCGIRPK